MKWQNSVSNTVRPNLLLPHPECDTQQPWMLTQACGLHRAGCSEQSSVMPLSETFPEPAGLRPFRAT